jgi:hypothetical protein
LFCCGRKIKKTIFTRGIILFLSEISKQKFSAENFIRNIKIFDAKFCGKQMQIK